MRVASSFPLLKNSPEPHSQTTPPGEPRNAADIDADSPAVFDVAAVPADDDFEDEEVSLRRERRKSLFPRWRRAWSIIAGAGVVFAGALLWWGRADAAFVVATLGVLAWFLNERNRLAQPGIEAHDREQDESER